MNERIVFPTTTTSTRQRFPDSPNTFWGFSHSIQTKEGLKFDIEKNLLMETGGGNHRVDYERVHLIKKRCQRRLRKNPKTRLYHNRFSFKKSSIPIIKN